MNQPLSISLTTDQYRATILPQRGANCVSLRHLPTGCDVLRSPGSVEDFTRENPFLFGMPILFFPNRIEDGRFTFDGRRYTFDINEPQTNCHIHGFLHETPFKVAEQSVAHAVLYYRADGGQPYGDFPHAFYVEVSYRLSEKGLEQKTRFMNHSRQLMPLALAFHTTFNMKLTAATKADEVELFLETQGEYQRNARLLPTGELLAKQLPLKPAGQMITALLKRKGNTAMKLCDPGHHIAVIYQADSQFTCWMVYNGGTSEYICVEPQTWVTNAPNMKGDPLRKGILSLPPGEQKCFTTKIHVETKEQSHSL